MLALALEQPEQTDVGDATGLHHRLLRHQAFPQRADPRERQLRGRGHQPVPLQAPREGHVLQRARSEEGEEGEGISL